MGFGDERGNIDPKYVEASEKLAGKLYPDMNTIPGGEQARPQRELDRKAAVRQGAFLLRYLDNHNAIDMSEVTALFED